MIGHANITILGTIVADAELAQEGRLMKLRVAVNERTKDGETKASFFNVESWREKLNASISKIPMKGKNVLITGNVYEDRWEKDGVKFKDYPIRLDKIIFTDKKGDSESSSNENPGF